MTTRLREMTPADVPAARALLAEQNARDGTSYGLPAIFDERGNRLAGIPLALVAVDEAGTVRQAHVYEWTVEHMTFGVDPRATVASIREQEQVWWLLRQRGARDLHILVPEERAGQMDRNLRGRLKATPTGMRHYYRLLDQAENEALRQFHSAQRAASERDSEPASGESQ